MISRRRFITTGSLAVAAGSVLPPAVSATTPKPAPAGLSDWGRVREQFDLDPTHTHLALFYLASHPRGVRQAIETYRKEIDGNPVISIEHAVFSAENNLMIGACEAVAGYIGGRWEDVALVQNTTTGLALIYQGLPLRAGDEIVTTTHDHYSHHESIRLAAERSGATWRRIALFDSHDAISADGIVDRVRRSIGPKTRALGITWVHSSSGLKLPLREIANAVAEINRERSASERVRVIVDGVHGIGVEAPEIVSTGIDAFAAGTHKWIFGPRGTGFVWAKPDMWASMRLLVPTFSGPEMFEAWAEEKVARPARGASFSPGGFQAFEHYWALPAAFEFHRQVGYRRVTDRIHELNGAMKEGLARMPHVTLYTPRARELSSGIVCFDVKGKTQNEVVEHLLKKHRIVASTTPYRISYARVAFGLPNTMHEVEKALAAIRAMA